MTSKGKNVYLFMPDGIVNDWNKDKAINPNRAKGQAMQGKAALAFLPCSLGAEGELKAASAIRMLI